MRTLDRNHAKRHAKRVSTGDRYRRKSRDRGRTAFVLALERAAEGRRLLSLSVDLDVPLGTLRGWLTYPPTRRSAQQDRARAHLSRMGHDET